MSGTAPPASPAPPIKRPRRWRRRLLVYGSLYLLWTILAMTGCADFFLLHPSRQPIAPRGARAIDVPTPDGGAVQVWTARADPGPPAEPPDAFLLVFIGNADRAEGAVHFGVEQAGRRRIEVWAMNYPGYGGSTGAARLRAIGPAALATYDAARARAGDRPIYVSGISIGNAAALHVAARRPVAGAILTNPPPLRRLLLGNYGWWNLWLAAGPLALSIPDELDTLANGRKCTAPAVFVLAGSDRIIPPKYQQMVAYAYAGEKRLVHVAGADHNDPLSGPAAIEAARAIDWMFDRTMPSPQGTSRPASRAVGDRSPAR